MSDIVEIVPLQAEHLEDAAALVVARYRLLRQQAPLMPARHEDAASLLPLLRELAERAPGVAAMRDGRLAGFMTGWLLPEFRGKAAAYSPEWANAADPEASRAIYGQLYTHLSQHWVARGHFVHLVSLMAYDRPAIDGWHWLGFGLIAVDAIRDLSPVGGTGVSVDIRRAGPEDAAPLLAQVLALIDHLASPPIYLFPDDDDDLESQRQWLADPAHAAWLAYVEGEAVAALGMGPANPKACYLIDDPETASVLLAFTDERLRRTGIGVALLDRGLEWARSAGYRRCAVDFEPENIPGAGFWTKHFQPVCHSLVRHVDERFGG